MEDLINVITLGDFEEVSKKIEDESIDLIITDPPFMVNFASNKFYDDKKNEEKLLRWLEIFYRVIKKNHHVRIFVPRMEIDLWINGIKKIGFSYNGFQTFKTYAKNPYDASALKMNAQDVIYASKGKPRDFNKIPWIKKTDAWLKDKRNKSNDAYTYFYPALICEDHANIRTNKFIKTKHPNEKNLNLIKNLIKISSDENNLILDGFCGSGTVADACIDLNRNFICVEKDEFFKNMASERIKLKMNLKNHEIRFD